MGSAIIEKFRFIVYENLWYKSSNSDMYNDIQIKSTQYKKLVPNALRFTYQNLKSCKPHEKTKQKTSKC